MSSKLFLIFLFLPCSLLIGCQEMVIFSNFGPDDEYDPEGYAAVDLVEHPGMIVVTAMAFTPPVSDSLQSIELALSIRGGDNEVDISLTNDEDGLPGAIIETIHVGNAIPDYPGVYPPVVATSTQNPNLQANTQYWIAVRATGPSDTSIDWHHNTTDDIGPLAQKDFGSGEPWRLSNRERAAFRVSGGNSPLFDNFGPGDSYHPEWYFAVGIYDDPFFMNSDIDTAMALTPQNDGFFLKGIEVAMSIRGGDNELDLWLMNDADGSPGTVIEEFHLSDAVPDYPGVYPPVTVFSKIHPVLNSNTQYWIGASASGPHDTLMDWHHNVIGDAGTRAQRNLVYAPEWGVSNNTRGAFRVTGSTFPPMN